MDTNTSPYGLAALWSQGDAVIKTVAVILLLMSIVSWWLIATRAWRLMKLRRAARASAAFWHARSFDEGLTALRAPGTPADALNPFRHLALEGQAAVTHHAGNQEDLHGQLSLAEWAGDALRAAIDDSNERLRAGLSVLASVGSTVPFIGLFGTVWGIYHALVGIGVSGQASIDKVAGPVGEALIMTAFGLAVAIPAVLGYNALNRANRTLTGQLKRFARQLHAYFLTGSPVQREAGVKRALVRTHASDRAQRVRAGTDGQGGTGGALAAQGADMASALSDFDDGEDADVSDINMTPLVDVMLVLLIIFIITVPVLTHSVKLDLPRAQAEVNHVPPQTVTLAVDAAGQVHWNEDPVSAAELDARLGAAAAQQPQPEMHVRGDRKAEYESVLRVMAAAQRAGVLKLGFVTEPGASNAPGGSSATGAERQ